MPKKIWLNWSDLEKKLFDNEYILFGVGKWAEKTMGKLNKKPIYIIDNNKSKQGTTFRGVEILPADYLKKIDEDFIIIISAGSYKSIIKQLKTMNFKEAIDFFCSPVLINNKIEQEIKNYNQQLIFTCSDAPDAKSKNSGGGLYTFNREGKRKKRKVHNGQFRGLVKSNNHYIVADGYEGIKVFNKKLELVNSYSALTNANIHGVSFWPEKNSLFISNTGRDSISIINLDSGEYEDEIFISSEYQNNGDRHHINDIYYHEGFLFISMFSFSGFWKKGVYDGGVAVLNLKNKKITNYIFNDLWMPHSIKFINGEIVIIDSMLGDIYKTSNKKLLNINGFIRGITFDGKYFYIGQSEHRHFNRLQDVSNNISINCGIHLYDEKSKVSRFISFENISNIHEIVIAD